MEHLQVTIRDKARLADVSVRTASMPLNNKSNINNETKREVLEIAKKK